MDVRAFLRAKRDGGAHAPESLFQFIRASMAGEVPDYQVSAWLMAAFVQGLNQAETEALTLSLADSGRTYDWSELGRPSADKHSTGGVGDKVSLVLAPLVAACGVLVPMVAGRGLGHTGGTIDKLEAIPGYQTMLSPEAMRAQLDSLGVFIVGQGPDLAPADGKLYALRDVTATVESTPLIVASIVSKKVAEGAGTLIYDVKCGNGAFMRTRDAARELANRLVGNTRAVGRKSAALVTRMDEPLGAAVGNILEVLEAVELLRGNGPEDVRSLTIELGALMLERCGAEPTLDAARVRLVRMLDSGAAWERFLALVEAQGGDPRVLERPDQTAVAPVRRQVIASRKGRVTSLDTFGLGELAVAIGAGRRAKGDALDPRVGFVMKVRMGDVVEVGDPIADLHLAEDRPEAAKRLAECIRIGNEPVETSPLVLERIG